MPSGPLSASNTRGDDPKDADHDSYADVQPDPPGAEGDQAHKVAATRHPDPVRGPDGGDETDNREMGRWDIDPSPGVRGQAEGDEKVMLTPATTSSTGGKRRKAYPRDIRTLANYLFGLPHGSTSRMESPEQRQMVLRVAKAFGGKLAPFAEAVEHEPEVSVVGLMKRDGVTYHDIVKAFQQVKLDEGMLRMYDHLPQVMEDVAKDALSKEKKCKACRGTGRTMQGEGDTTEEIDCLACDGTGWYVEMGDAGSRKLLFDAAGLTSKVGVQVNQQFNTLDGSEALETLVGSARNALAPPKVITATVTDGN